MPRKNLTQQIIVDEAIKLISANGYYNFSIRALARHLDIKAASLYNHFKNLEEITSEVIKRILVDYNEFKINFVGDKQRDEALFAYADAVKTYSVIYPELYGMILLFPSLNLKTSINKPFIVETLMNILHQYDIEEIRLYHLQRVYRSIIQGFIASEKAGFFHDETINKTESYRFAVRTFIEMLHAEEAKNKK